MQSNDPETNSMTDKDVKLKRRSPDEMALHFSMQIVALQAELDEYKEEVERLQIMIRRWAAPRGSHRDCHCNCCMELLKEASHEEPTP